MPELSAQAVLLRRGHPGKGKSRKTVVRSVRLPDAIWRELEAKARDKHLNVHQAMRAALLGWLRRTG
jgi:predicted DNA-binding ribbon-helix-helix protein